jgi:uncharacterized protein YdaU (DUF1376 family)
MKASPAFQFYPQDFLVGTAMLSAEEVGAYIRLLCYSWTHDGLPNDPAQLSRLAGASNDAIASIRHKFGICEDGKLRNDRQESIREKQKAYKAVQKANAEKRWKNTENEQCSVPPHMPSHNPPHIPTDDPSHSIGICQTDALHSSSSSSNSIKDSLKNKEGSGEGKIRTSQANNEIIDELFLAELRRHYPQIRVDVEMQKIDAWLSVHKDRRKTRRFVVGWMNRNIELNSKTEEEVESEFADF